MWPGNALPQHGATNWQVFYATSPSGAGGNEGWQTYMKPPGASMIYILMLAAGGGGSRQSDGNAASGAGGGASGGMSRMLIPAFFLPDIIYVRPGKGGLGATVANTIGEGGSTSFVSIAPSTASSDVIFSQGGGRANTTPQFQGLGGLAGSVTGGAFTNVGLWYTRAGQNGGAGGGTGLSVTAGQAGIITTGGSGGSSGGGAAGSISGSGFFPTLTGGGRDGFQRGAIISPGLKSFPLIFTGGTGGSGVSTATTAGKGGDASYGGGGGGGGGGTNVGSISGNGGNGGDGLIIIGTL